MRRETFILIAMPALFGLGFTLGKLSDTSPIPVSNPDQQSSEDASPSFLKLILIVLLPPQLGLSIKKAPPRMR